VVCRIRPKRSSKEPLCTNSIYGEASTIGRGASVVDGGTPLTPDAGAPPPPPAGRTPSDAGAPPSAPAPSPPARAPRVPVAPGTQGTTVTSRVTLELNPPVPSQITWEDNFTPVDRAATTSPYSALTTTGIGTDTRTGRGGAITKVVVHVKMPKADSWVVKAEESPELLQHEILHYRIACQVGRDLKADITSLPAKATMADVDPLREASIAKNQQISDQYDADTDHGANADQQAAWTKKVEGWERANKVSWP
jgi:hypothetical protein